MPPGFWGCRAEADCGYHHWLDCDPIDMPASPDPTACESFSAHDLALLQCLMDALPQYCALKDPQQRLVLINQAGAHMLGGTVEGLRGRSLDDLVSPQAMAQARAQDQVAWAQRCLQQFDDQVWDTHSQQWRGMLSFKSPLFDAQGQPRYMMVQMLDVTVQRTLERQSAGELELLELLTAQTPLPELLAAFTRRFEATYPEVMSSVLLLDADGQHLRHGAAPSLPPDYYRAIDGVPIGPQGGSCATAAYTRQTVIVSDIAQDPLWQDYRHLALPHGLRACWSVPILSSNGQVLGTFANYHRQPREPLALELQAIKRAAYLVALAIEHQRAQQMLAQQRQALQESEARYRTLVEWSPEAVAVHRNGVLIYVNKACVHLLHAKSPQDLLGRNIAELLHPDYRELGLARAKRAMESREGAPAIEEKLLCIDGATVDVEIQSIAILYDGVPAVYVVAHDITQRHRDEQTIHNLAFYDALTGLPNRRLMLDRLQQALASADRKQRFGALLLLDLDHFKKLNDLRGHNVGDALLQQVARRLQVCLRKSDSVGRVGGDEFMVLLDTLTDNAVQAAHYAESVAQKILLALRQDFSLAEQHYRSSSSIGALIFMQGDEQAARVMQHADAALYQAKAAGRDTVCFFDPHMQAQALARAAFEQDMRAGLAQQQFVLHYQLQVNRQGQPLGAEALVRWHSPDRGLVPPGEFIALAEENGLILPLGQWVLEAACAQLVAWAQDAATCDWVLAVNVSARQFAQSDFVQGVRQALQRTGANPQRLKLELTESMLVHDVHDVIAKMNEAKALGVSFSLDDFGTGYSSLSYLKTLPLAQLKIDQSFVRDLLTDVNDAVICRTVVALGHSLGMRVIAEGVETQAQRDALVDMDCDAFQGYFFSRPVPLAHLAQALASLPVTS
ncbi:MAG: hypothetical protein Fur007_10060 [Rhodoferax sp.]